MCYEHALNRTPSNRRFRDFSSSEPLLLGHGSDSLRAMDYDADYTMIFAIGIPLFVMAVGVGLFFFLRIQTEKKEEEYYHFRCPGCKHKLKYLARQVGHRGMCGNCKEQFTFPPLT
jgi:hypothetical protein